MKILSTNSLLDWFNYYEGLATWLTALVTSVAVIYGVKEFFIKRRPYLDVEIEFSDVPVENGGGWHFFVKLINKGTYPGKAKITKTELRIGDETYPTTFKHVTVLSVGESKKILHVGTIKKLGINKILGHEYRSNRVELEVVVDSAELGGNVFKYRTKIIYEINVLGEKPEFLLVDEEYK